MQYSVSIDSTIKIPMKNYAIIHSYSMMMSMQIIPEINPNETQKKPNPIHIFTGV